MALFIADILNSVKRWQEDTSMMNDWLFSNEVLLTTNNWIFSPVITAHYYVPTESGSIGSNLTRKNKVSTQHFSIERIMLQRQFSHSSVDQFVFSTSHNAHDAAIHARTES